MADGQVIYEIRADGSMVEKDLDQAHEKVEKRGEKFKNTAKKIGLAMGAGLAVAGGAAIKLGSDFESAMAGASTLFGDANVNTEELNNRMLELSSSTGYAADQLGGALYNALSAGVPATDDMSEALSFLDSSSRLAKAGFTDIDTAMSATIKTLNAYKMDVSEAEKIQKILIQTQNKGIATVGELGSVLAQVTPTAAAMNVSFEQVGAGLAVMTAAGTPAAQATTQLNQLFAELGKTGTQAQKNLVAAAKGTEYAGKSFQELMAEGVPLNEVLRIMGEYAAENEMGMLDMFSSIEAGKAALANSGQNAEAFTEALAAMSTETDVVGEGFEKVSNTSGEQFRILINQLKNMAIELFLTMQPFIMELLPDLMEQLEVLLPPLMEIVGEILPPLGDALIQALPLLSEIVEAVLPPLLELFRALLPPITEIVSDLLPPLIELFTELADPLMELIKAVIPPFTDLLIALAPVMIEFIEEIVPVLTQLFREFIPVLITIIQDVLPPIIQLFLALLPPLERLISALLPMLINLFETLMPAINAVVEILGPLIAVFGDLITQLVNALSPALEVVIDLIGKGMANSIEGVMGLLDGLKRFLNGLIDFLTGVFTGNWTKAWQGVKDIFSGIVSGLGSIFRAPLNTMIDGINMFIDGVNKVKVPSWVPIVGGRGFHISRIPRLKVGLDYVPDDDFPALLHEGEAVLTAEEADAWRKNIPRFPEQASGLMHAQPEIQNNITLYATIEADGFKLGQVVLRNLDDVRSFT